MDKKNIQYDKLDEYGFLPETKLVQGDIIIGRVNQMIAATGRIPADELVTGSTGPGSRTEQ